MNTQENLCEKAHLIFGAGNVLPEIEAFKTVYSKFRECSPDLWDAIANHLAITTGSVMCVEKMETWKVQAILKPHGGVSFAFLRAWDIAMEQRSLFQERGTPEYNEIDECMHQAQVFLFRNSIHA